ncbi:NADH dehydrogenase [ubiquinone] 1 beta subcomplex subunit 3-like [Balaenoptera ricei]|uniref:NADH dehydrogenase [ubiquinone] 1 beta subcomplex subunit 3-like n=1 Tax=Balaenoptera ricei TaxID=2746895 RepID=UPI0028BDB6B3|nr:NADH dehydrogenase [ubiquinone] 1 beta subcomplex subunit 3-like [Balaenoptera ricei]
MAHGHGHEHGHSKMELPDYKQWTIEGTPLETVQEKLAARGLRDPWGRNEAWRYMGGFANNVSFVGALLKGFKWEKKKKKRSTSFLLIAFCYPLHDSAKMYLTIPFLTDITVLLFYH